MEVLENAQKAATKLMVPKLRKFSYPIRLRMLGITSLKERRGDVIEVYKLMTEKEQINPGQFFTPAETHYKLRGHDKKLTKARPNWTSGNTFSAREWSTHGTDYQQKLLTRNLSMHSRTPTTAYAATIWTFKADQLCSPSTYTSTSTSTIKFKFRIGLQVYNWLFSNLNLLTLLFYGMFLFTNNETVFVSLLYFLSLKMKRFSLTLV